MEKKYLTFDDTFLIEEEDDDIVITVNRLDSKTDDDVVNSTNDELIKEKNTKDNIFVDIKEDDEDLKNFTIHIKDFVIDESYHDLYGAQETVRRFENELKFGCESRALALAKEFAEKQELEKNRKKEVKRLYKTDKKYYNLIEDDKYCKKDKTENRIYTRVNIRKIKKLLKYEEITYKEVAKALNISERSLIRKFNVYTDLSANELITICDLLKIDINEIIYKNEH